jgi:hypothetical protein
MRTKVATAVLVLVSTVFANNEFPEVSRLGKNVLTLNEVSTPGFATPKVLYGKTKNATEEPRFKENLTPLGQRQ